jgi:hypothetical protein
MGDLLHSGLAWLADQLHAHASRPITYRRGVQQVALNATLGRKDFEADTHEGRLYIRANDVLVRAADLVLGGQLALPERGDQIDVNFDGATATFEVLGQDGIPPWEFSDPHQQVLRIHTKKVA